MTPESLILWSITYTLPPAGDWFEWRSYCSELWSFPPTLKLRRRSGDEEPEREMTECIMDAWFQSGGVGLDHASPTSVPVQPTNEQNGRFGIPEVLDFPKQTTKAYKYPSGSRSHFTKSFIHTQTHMQREWPHVDNISVTIKSVCSMKTILFRLLTCCFQQDISSDIIKLVEGRRKIHMEEEIKFVFTQKWKLKIIYFGLVSLQISMIFILLI